MIKRSYQPKIEEALNRTSAVAIIGPRQVGKTTLALTIAENFESIYIDLELPGDLQKLDDPGYYFDQHHNKLIVIDEVQRKPELFQVLRSQIDKNRRAGHRNAQFLLLGSASNELLNQSSETNDAIQPDLTKFAGRDLGVVVELADTTGEVTAKYAIEVLAALAAAGIGE